MVVFDGLLVVAGEQWRTEAVPVKDGGSIWTISRLRGRE